MLLSQTVASFGDDLEGSLHTLHRTSVDFEANVELVALEDPENKSINFFFKVWRTVCLDQGSQTQTGRRTALEHF